MLNPDQLILPRHLSKAQRREFHRLKQIGAFKDMEVAKYQIALAKCGHSPEDEKTIAQSSCTRMNPCYSPFHNCPGLRQ